MRNSIKLRSKEKLAQQQTYPDRTRPNRTKRFQHVPRKSSTLTPL